MESPVRTVHLTQSHKVTNDQPTKLKYFTRRPNPGRPHFSVFILSYKHLLLLLLRPHFALGDMGRPPLPVKVDTGQQQNGGVRGGSATAGAERDQTVFGGRDPGWSI
jgi:hypothetical protein